MNIEIKEIIFIGFERDIVCLGSIRGEKKKRKINQSIVEERLIAIDW